MGILDGGLAKVFGAAFSGIYLLGKVYRARMVKETGGKMVKTFAAGVDCRYQPERTTQAMREKEGYTDKDGRFFILTAGLGALSKDDEFTTSAGRWQVVDTGTDPAGAAWDVHARPARGG